MSVLAPSATISGVTSTSKNLRRVLLGTAAAALITLSACGGEAPGATETSVAPTPSAAQSVSPAATPTPTASVSPAADLSAVKVSDEDTPVVTVEAPWAIAKTQSKVLKPGTSAQKVGETATVSINYVGVNGRTGEIFDSSYERGAPASFPLDGVIPGFKLGLQGQQVGSRVVIGVTPEDGYPQGTQDGSIAPGDSLIFVVDILSASFDEATGEPVAPAAGLPAVTLKDGKPEIAIPAGAKAPTELQIQPLIKGTGAPVAADSTVSVKYRSWNFADGALLEDAWQAQAGPLPKLIQGWQKGLVGQPAGSRVLLVVPPAQAYPDGRPSATPSLAPDQTLVYVIDILDVQAAAS